MRYSVILLPCESTAKSFWGAALFSAASIEALFNKFGWTGDLDHDQKWAVRDSRKGEDISPEQYWKIIRAIKGWPEPSM